MARGNNAFSVAKRELKAAERHLANMRECESFEEMDREWRGFLVSIEKVWKKAERGGVGINNGKFSKFQKPFKDYKKKDKLLSYILHARNSDEHSIQEVVGHLKHYSCVPISIVRAVGQEGKIIAVNPLGPPLLEMENKFELVGVADRGVDYSPPWSKDPVVGRMSPVEAADTAIAFYRNYMAAIEREFLTSCQV